MSDRRFPRQKRIGSERPPMFEGMGEKAPTGDDTRVLLYSLTHGGYVAFVDSVDCGYSYVQPLRLGDSFERVTAETFIRIKPSRRLVIADLDGWIQHDGGKRPVGYSTAVEIRKRGGGVVQGQAGEFWWSPWPVDKQSEIAEWRPAQEERDGRKEQAEIADMESSDRRTVDTRDRDGDGRGRRTDSVADPVTPDAAGVGGVRERLEALGSRLDWEAPCDCDACDCGNADDAARMGDWRGDQATVAEVRAILAALPEGELIDAREIIFASLPWDVYGPEPAYGAQTMIRVDAPGTYRVFLQRKEVG